MQGKIIVLKNEIKKDLLEIDNIYLEIQKDKFLEGLIGEMKG